MADVNYMQQVEQEFGTQQGGVTQTAALPQVEGAPEPLPPMSFENGTNPPAPPATFSPPPTNPAPLPPMKEAPPIVDLYSSALSKTPQSRERPTTNVYQNAVLDLQDMIQGTAALTNAAVLRSIQAMPANPTIPLAQGRAPFSGIAEAYNQIGSDLDAEKGPVERIQKSPTIFGKAAQTVINDPDAKAIRQYAGGAVNDTYNRYIAPFGNGLAAGGTAIEEQLYKHPIGTFLDLGMGPSLKRGAGATNILYGKAAKTGLGQKVTGAMRPHVDALDAILNHPAASPHPLAQALLYSPLGYKSKLLIALQPLQFPWQAIQNGVIFTLGNIKGPKDVLYAATGMMLAGNPKVRQWIPKEFFGGGAQHLATDLPKWLAWLSWPDRLMDKHLGLIEKGDNYWRAAAALTMATRELANVANRKQFQLLAETYGLSYSAAKNLKAMLADERMANEFLQEVHRTMGNYNKVFSGSEAILARNVMFYRALRHMFILSTSFPFENQYKTAALHALSQQAVKLAESEPINKRLKEAGAVLVRDSKGNLILGPNGIPLVYAKGVGMTPLLMSYQIAQTVAKLANREGLGDVEFNTSSIVTPLADLTAAAFGIKLSTLEPFRDPNSTRISSGAQVKDAVAKRVLYTGKVNKEDLEKRPQPPIEAMLGHAIAPATYQSLVQFHEYMQQIPGKPSDFSTLLGTPAPLRKPTGQKVKPMEMQPGQFLFGKLQASEPSMSVQDEKNIERSTAKKVRRAYQYKHRQWQQ